MGVTLQNCTVYAGQVGEPALREESNKRHNASSSFGLSGLLFTLSDLNMAHHQALQLVGLVSTL